MMSNVISKTSYKWDQKENDIGRIIRAKSFSNPHYTDRDATVLCNNAGMNGDESIYQMHGDELDTMWISTKNPTINPELWFDLGESIQVSCMLIWNFNQKGNTKTGLRLVKIYTSNDFINWEEFISNQSPFIFKQSPDEPWISATNLEGENKEPVWFSGKTFRYLKIIPHEDMFVGNHGEYIEGQNRYGLSAVRFYQYKPQVKENGYIPSKVIIADKSANNLLNNYSKYNVCNGLGMSDENTLDAVLTNDKNHMWLSEINPKFGEIIFDLGGTYPLSEMHVWNYNEKNNASAGIKNVKIYYSKSRMNWVELKGPGYPYVFAKASGNSLIKATNLEGDNSRPVVFNNISARFVKIVIDGLPGTGTHGYYNGFEHRFGIGKVRFFLGNGYCVEPDFHFTGLLSNYHGWSGADGIFMVPFDGVEAQTSGIEAKTSGVEAQSSDSLEEISNRKTITIFSDTFYGEVNPVTSQRKRYTVLNNSSAEFFGNKPQNIDFQIKKDISGNPESLIPNPIGGEYFYWLQDCFVQNERLYAFTDNIIFDESGMEGFQFNLIGVDMVKIDIKAGSLNYDSINVVKTPLYINEPKAYFGCAILPNSFSAKLPFADGFIYVYGLKDNGLLEKSLLVARVESEHFENFEKYTFFNGVSFVSGIENASPICDEGGAEMSITPITDGPNKGNYLYIYSNSSVGTRISCRIAQTPWGPFSESELLYDTQEIEEISKFGGEKIYTYNAKAHYHISSPDELLISYNVNSMDFESHLKNAQIYRPRFLSMKKIK